MIPTLNKILISSHHRGVNTDKFWKDYFMKHANVMKKVKYRKILFLFLTFTENYKKKFVFRWHWQLNKNLMSCRIKEVNADGFLKNYFLKHCTCAYFLTLCNEKKIKNNNNILYVYRDSLKNLGLDDTFN